MATRAPYASVGSRAAAAARFAAGGGGRRGGPDRRGPRSHRDRNGERGQPRLPALPRRYSQTYGPGLANRVRAIAASGADAVLDAIGSGSLFHLVEIAPSPAQVVTIADPAAADHGARIWTTASEPAYSLAT